MKGQKLLRIISIVMIVFTAVSILCGVLTLFSMSATKTLVSSALLADREALEADEAALRLRADDVQRRAEDLSARAAEMESRAATLEQKADELKDKQTGFEESALELSNKAKELETRSAELATAALTATEDEKAALEVEKVAIADALNELNAKKRELAAAVEEFKKEAAEILPDLTAEKKALEEEAAEKLPAMQEEKAQIEEDQAEITAEKETLDARKAALVSRAESAAGSIKALLAVSLLSFIFAVASLAAGIIGIQASKMPSIVKIKVCILLGSLSLLLALAIGAILLAANFIVSLAIFSLLCLVISALYFVGIITFKNSLVALLSGE